MTSAQAPTRAAGRPGRHQKPQSTPTADLWQEIGELAGRIPDDGLVMMRMAVHAGEPVTAIHMIGDAVTSGRLKLTRKERARLSRLARAYRTDPQVFDKAQPAERDPLPYTFVEPDLEDEWADAVDDLAVLAATGAQQVIDEDADEDSEPGVVVPEGPLRVRAMWRVQRRSPRTTVDVRLLELVRGADPIAVTADTITALSEMGEMVPRVEIFTEDDALTPYQSRAMNGAVLVWVADDPVQPEIAAVFDGPGDGDGMFAEDHPRLTGSDRDQVLGYLRSAATLLSGPDRVDDVVTGRPTCVPLDYRTDGQWMWSAATEYYLEEHGLAPDPDLVEHARTATPRPVSRLERHIAMETLLEAARVAIGDMEDLAELSDDAELPDEVHLPAEVHPPADEAAPAGGDVDPDAQAEVAVTAETASTAETGSAGASAGG